MDIDQGEKAVHPDGPTILASNRGDGSSIDSSNDDIAALIASDHAQRIDPEVERRVLRKIDVFLIPLMWIGYGFVYYDKARHREANTQVEGLRLTFTGYFRQCGSLWYGKRPITQRGKHLDKTAHYVHHEI